ncbi:MAG: DUF4435 domain-containing protein [Bacteroides sp.]
MAQSLKGNLSSDYFKAAQKLYSKKARKRIIAYVESYDDIGFWRTLLEGFENDRYFFQVMLPSAQNLTKGKKMVLKNSISRDNFGDSLIACVDSDYDFLLQDSTPTSRALNTNKYIFHTYAYAIENYFCFAESLHEVCVQATLNDKTIFDFERYLQEFSELTYPLFLWTIWFAKKRDTQAFPMYQFNRLTRVYAFKVNNPKQSLDRIREKVQRKQKELERNYPEDVMAVHQLGKSLEPLGLSPQTTYLFIQGHHIFEQVVMKILKPVCAVLRQQRERYIERLAIHKEQYENEITAYRNSITDVELALKKNFGFKNLFAYHWLQKDLQSFIENIN